MKLKNSISDKGYIIVKNALNKKLIREIQNKILKGNNKNSYTAFSKKISKIKNKKLFKFINPINKILFNENLIDKLLLEKKVISELRKLLGSDLAFSEGSLLATRSDISSIAPINGLLKLRSTSFLSLSMARSTDLAILSASRGFKT